MTIAAVQSSVSRGRGMRMLLLAALLASAAVYACRGPIFACRQQVQGSSSSIDFILVYSASRAWVTGGNPYDKAVIDQTWLDAGGPFERRPSTRAVGDLIYPPTTLLMFAPFGALPWQTALPVWVFANIGFLLVSVGLIARIAGWCLTGNRTVLLLTLAFLFMPVHTAVRVGQTPLYVLALICAAAWAGKSVARGFGWSAASLIKPQIGLPFLALDVLRRRWSAVFWAIASGAVVTLISIAPMVLHRIAWWGNWRTNMLNQQLTGGQGDPTRANPMRHQLINLQYPLHEFIESRTVVNLLVFAIVGAIAIAFFRFWIWDFGFWIVRHQTRSESSIQNPKSKIQNAAADEMLSLSMVAVLGLLIVYHRFYDAVLLLLPLAWAIGALSRDRFNRAAWCVVVLLFPFFLNSATVLYWLKYENRLPSWLADRWWWDALLMPHQGWALVLMALCLLWGQRGDHACAAVEDSETR